MSLPVILAVDEDTDALRNVERELEDRYASLAGVDLARSARAAPGACFGEEPEHAERTS
jgi:hypothetical protein